MRVAMSSKSQPPMGLRWQIGFLQHYLGLHEQAKECAERLSRSGFKVSPLDLAPNANGDGFVIGAHTHVSLDGSRIVVISEKAARLAFGDPTPCDYAVSARTDDGQLLWERD